jgi:hypothetical protein
VASDVTDEPEEPNSPVCLAHEADDAYMGFASQSEVAAFLLELAEAERKHLPSAEMLRKMLPKVRDEVLHHELNAKLRAQEATESGT